MSDGLKHFIMYDGHEIEMALEVSWRVWYDKKHDELFLLRPTEGDFVEVFWPGNNVLNFCPIEKVNWDQIELIGEYK